MGIRGEEDKGRKGDTSLGPDLE